MEANKEKERGTQPSLDGVFIREEIGPWTHSSSNPSKGGAPKSSYK